MRLSMTAITALASLFVCAISVQATAAPMHDDVVRTVEEATQLPMSTTGVTLASTDANVLGVLTRLENLESLELAGMPGGQNELLSTLKAFPRLHTLALAGTIQLNEVGTKILNEIPDLKTLIYSVVGTRRYSQQA